MAHIIQKESDDGALTGVVLGVVLVVLVAFLMFGLERNDRPSQQRAVPDTVRVELPDVNVEAPQAAPAMPQTGG
jgi:hypothetical protein